MIRTRGDRASLLAALLAHWSEEQHSLPQQPQPWMFKPTSRGATAAQGRGAASRRRWEPGGSEQRKTEPRMAAV